MPGPQLGYALPYHLPKKLSIGMFIWNWVTMATPGEPYHDLEKAVAGLPERGFNAVRVEAGLNWCFRMDGQPRGEMEFGPWIAGYRDNLTSVNARGGGRHDVLKRVTRLMELAKQHGVYVILTSWEYQDSSWLVADPKTRAEVMAVPEEKRLMHMARQHDRLLRVLKDKGLHRNIAFVEVHNEPDAREAQCRKVPAVCDEGGYFYPPSQIEVRASPARHEYVRASGRPGDQSRLLGYDADDELRSGASDLGQRRVAPSHQWPVPVGKVAGVEDTRSRRRDESLQQEEIFHAQGSPDSD